MMLPTHALSGMALGLPLVALAPELAPAALVGGFVGGIVPDLDLYAGHRRTLHYPTLYPIAALPLVFLALAVTTPVAVAAAFVLLGAALHCRMDIYGSGLELRPWEGNSERAVYDHVDGEWLPPRRFVAYDGSKGDLAITAAIGAPLLLFAEPPLTILVAVTIVVAVLYVILRRRLAALAPTVFGLLPEPIESHVPDRYRES
jgi:hypothetical protein